MNLSKNTRRAIPPALVAAASVIALGLAQHSAAEQSIASPRANSDGPVILSAMEYYPSSSLADWAAGAEYLVSAFVTSEATQNVPPLDGEGDSQLIGRDITIDTAEVLWRADDSTHPAPSTFTMPVTGWVDQSGKLVEAAPDNGPRLEVGHEYVLALTWYDAQCGEDGNSPAGWGAVGSEGAVPADGGVVGEGEFEGVAVDPEAAVAAVTVASQEASGVAPQVVAEFSGDTPAAIAQKIDDVTPTVLNENAEKMESEASCSAD
ncbi:hypothetical protein FE697_019300 [Mumia zhuanghuii]|uniref:Uncharacterized protein n=2 Tax=Mumia TaxID=1546255 RepID=A0ABW1QN80_9ACTN|nr:MULTISPECIES: hypothetical protein [Mumia]KAA1420028.1 hypothetical protein FE697_019300 [Mumia zhuanghuii]